MAHDRVARQDESPTEVPYAGSQETSVLVLLYLLSYVCACVCLIFSTLNPAPLSTSCASSGIYSVPGPVQIIRNNREPATAAALEGFIWRAR